MAYLASIALNIALTAIFGVVAGIVGAAAYDRFKRRERGE